MTEDTGGIENPGEGGKKEAIESLKAKTDLEEEDIIAAHKTFHERYPNGIISKREFLKCSKVRMSEPSLILNICEYKSWENLNLT